MSSDEKVQMPQVEAVLEILRAQEAGLKASALADHFGVSHQPLRARLRGWEAEGLLRRTGNTKATVWHLNDGEAPPPSPEAKRDAQRRLVRPDPERAAAERAQAAEAPKKAKGGRKAKAPKAKGSRVRKAAEATAPLVAAEAAPAAYGSKAGRAGKAGGVNVWRVRTAADATAYVLGATLLDAADAAGRAVGDGVVSIDLLGEVVGGRGR